MFFLFAVIRQVVIQRVIVLIPFPNILCGIVIPLCAFVRLVTGCDGLFVGPQPVKEPISHHLFVGHRAILSIADKLPYFQIASAVNNDVISHIVPIALIGKNGFTLYRPNNIITNNHAREAVIHINPIVAAMTGSYRVYVVIRNLIAQPAPIATTINRRLVASIVAGVDNLIMGNQHVVAHNLDNHMRAIMNIVVCGSVTHTFQIYGRRIRGQSGKIIKLTVSH